MAAIKALYVELGIEQRFKDYEAASYAKLEVGLMDSCRGLAVHARWRRPLGSDWADSHEELLRAYIPHGRASVCCCRSLYGN